MDLQVLRQRCSVGEQFRYLYFWGHQPSKDGTITSSCMSQWYRSPFEIDGITYPTAEHWMMSSKARLFADDESLRLIFGTTEPSLAKAVGRNVRYFDDEVWKANEFRLISFLCRVPIIQIMRAYFG